jgi:hypothetical protein
MQHTVLPSWYQREGYIKAMSNLIEKELKSFDCPKEVEYFFPFAVSSFNNFVINNSVKAFGYSSLFFFWALLRSIPEIELQFHCRCVCIKSK